MVLFFQWPNFVLFCRIIQKTSQGVRMLSDHVSEMQKSYSSGQHAQVAAVNELKRCLKELEQGNVMRRIPFFYSAIFILVSFWFTFCRILYLPKKRNWRSLCQKFRRNIKQPYRTAGRVYLVTLHQMGKISSLNWKRKIGILSDRLKNMKRRFGIRKPK